MIRRAGAGDFGAVTELLHELGRSRVVDLDACRSVYEQQLAEGAAHLIALVDDVPVGFCSLHFRSRLNEVSPQAWIPDLIVTSSARRQGVARALLTEADRLAREAGCHGLTLESGHHRAEAHRLYEASGMKNAGFYFTKGVN